MFPREKDHTEISSRASYSIGLVSATREKDHTEISSRATYSIGLVSAKKLNKLFQWILDCVSYS